MRIFRVLLGLTANYYVISSSMAQDYDTLDATIGVQKKKSPVPTTSPIFPTVPSTLIPTAPPITESPVRTKKTLSPTTQVSAFTNLPTITPETSPPTSSPTKHEAGPDVRAIAGAIGTVSACLVSITGLLLAYRKYSSDIDAPNLLRGFAYNAGIKMLTDQAILSNIHLNNNANVTESPTSNRARSQQLTNT